MKFTSHLPVSCQVLWSSIEAVHSELWLRYNVETLRLFPHRVRLVQHYWASTPSWQVRQDSCSRYCFCQFAQKLHSPQLSVHCARSANPRSLKFATLPTGGRQDSLSTRLSALAPPLLQRVLVDCPRFLHNVSSCTVRPYGAPAQLLRHAKHVLQRHQLHGNQISGGQVAAANSQSLSGGTSQSFLRRAAASAGAATAVASQSQARCSELQFLSRLPLRCHRSGSGYGGLRSHCAGRLSERVQC